MYVLLQTFQEAANLLNSNKLVGLEPGADLQTGDLCIFQRRL
jgi:hypothetical protein